jgi:membrane-bound ClpP family serine protease
VLAWHALENAFARWPRRRLGAMLVAGAFVFTVGALVLAGPLLPDAQLHIRFIATMVIAALTTIWVATPAVVFALRLNADGSRAAVQRGSPPA